MGARRVRTASDAEIYPARWRMGEELDRCGGKRPPRGLTTCPRQAPYVSQQTIPTRGGACCRGIEAIRIERGASSSGARHRDLSCAMADGRRVRRCGGNQPQRGLTTCPTSLHSSQQTIPTRGGACGAAVSKRSASNARRVRPASDAEIYPARWRMGEELDRCGGKRPPRGLTTCPRQAPYVSQQTTSELRANSSCSPQLTVRAPASRSG